MKRIDSFSLRSKIAFGTLSQIASRLAIAALSIFTLRYATTYLGAETYGIYATIIAYVTIFTLLTDLGLTAICSREIAKRPDDTEKIIGNGLAMRVLLSLALSPLIALGGFWLYATKPEEVKIGIALMVLTLLFGSIQSVTSALFTARNRSDLPALLNVINKAAYLLAIVAAGMLGLGLYGFIYAAIIAAMLSAGLSAYWAAKQLRLRPQFHLNHWKAMAVMSLPLGIIQIINMLYYKIDSIMLSVMRSPAEVGLYAIAYGIIDVVVSVPSMFMTSLMPTLATATKAQLQSIVQRAFELLAFFAVPIAIGGALLSREVILLISSNAFIGAATPFAILVVGAAFSYLNSVFGFASVALNKQGRLLKVSIITIILNVLINLLLIPRYGVTGAATATLITEIVACIGVYAIFSRQTGIRVKGVKVLVFLAAGLLMVPVKLGIDQLLAPSFMQFAIAGIAISLVYVTTLAALRVIPADLLQMARRMLPKRSA
jgi:O-antigen/teichoic acid export membrane protein